MLDAGSVIAGEIRLLVDGVATPLVKAALGAVSGLLVVVAQTAGGVVPLCAVVQPAGSAVR